MDASVRAGFGCTCIRWGQVVLPSELNVEGPWLNSCCSGLAGDLYVEEAMFEQLA